MGLFNRNKFERGMEAGAKPFQDKFEQVSGQLDELNQTIVNKTDEIANVNDAILTELSSRDKKELFDLNLEKAIDSLDDEDKEFALGLLYSLAKLIVDISDYQKDYLIRLQRYFDIQEPICISVRRTIPR